MSGVLAYLIALCIAIPFCAWACRQSWFDSADSITRRRESLRDCVFDEGGPDQPEGYEEAL